MFGIQIRDRAVLQIILIVLYAIKQKNGIHFLRYAVARPTKPAGAQSIKSGIKILRFAVPMLIQLASLALDSRRNGTQI